jgi:hypothetical protein
MNARSCTPGICAVHKHGGMTRAYCLETAHATESSTMGVLGATPVNGQDHRGAFAMAQKGAEGYED